jgi:hypothetical protein
MRGRQRHFNARDAGSTVALDARFITGFADGAAIASVVDRAGTTVTRTTGTGVTYETNEINGQPAIGFDPSGSFRFRAPVSITSNALTIIAISSKTGNAAGVADDFSRIWSLSNSGAADFNTTNGGIAYYNTSDPSADVFRNFAGVASRAITYAVAHLTSFRLSGSNVDWALNGAATTGTTSATALNANEIGIGAPINTSTLDSFLNGFIGLLIVIPVAVSDSLRKRLEHAAALSFKIPCA